MDIAVVAILAVLGGLVVAAATGQPWAILVGVTVGARLATVERLRTAGTITAAEADARRAAILDDI